MCADVLPGNSGKWNTQEAGETLYFLVHLSGSALVLIGVIRVRKFISGFGQYASESFIRSLRGG
jgi:hypothetical protein